MPIIQVLDSHTIDKIAAGEVVERPSSIVKELVENAIDAKATAITVEIKDGGTTFIRVTDNGSGIEKEQVKRAFLRHATSKITSANDLYHIQSLGFRGEALSSIAAVSQVEFISKTENDLTGMRYVIEGAKDISYEEIGAPIGTTIMVRNLFFNIPVRRKFLKTAATEGGYISDLMEHLALSKPNISFKYIMNQKTKFHTSGNGQLQEVVYRIYGSMIHKELIPIAKEENGIRLTGFLGKPTINRSTRNFETTFVNNRFVKSSLLAKAIEEAYRPFSMQHKFPFCVLHMEIEPSEVDVNIHPTKMDIRFTNPTLVSQLISELIKNCLQQIELIPEVTLLTKEEEKEEIKVLEQEFEAQNKYVPEPFEQKRREEQFVKEEVTYVTNGKNIDTINEEKRTKLQELLHKSTVNKIIASKENARFDESEKNHSNVIKANQQVFVKEANQLNLFDDRLLTEEAKKNHQILGQIFHTYWLVAFQDKLFLVDQHAAHEKVKYERLVKRIEENNIDSQILNPPIVVTLTAKEETVFAQYKDYFEKLGFVVEAFGGNDYAIRSVPTDLFGCNEKELFEEILDELVEIGVRGNPTVILEKIASMSCKAAVKGNSKMAVPEMEKLFDELLTLENPYHCPHGRPTIISMSKYEIDKKFKRIL